MTATASVYPRRVPEDATLTPRDEAEEILRCLRESLREPAFATAPAVVLSGKREGEESDSAERVAPGASGAVRNDW